MTSPFVGELLGTMTLIIFGDGVVAGDLLKHSKAEGSGWIMIATAWGLAVVMAIFVATATGSPEAHINPAVTVANAILKGDASKLAVFIPAQMIGAFLGATIVWLHYLPHWAATEDKEAKLGCFCTGPAIRDLKANALAEIIGTAVLIFVIAAIASKTVNAPIKMQPGLIPYFVGLLVWVIGMSLGGTTGYAINPARDLGPRFAHFVLPIAGKGDSDWGYALVPVVAPIVGAALAAGFVKLVGIV